MVSSAGVCVGLRYLTGAVVARATVAEEGAVLGVRQLVVLVAHLRTHRAHANALHHLTRVAVVPADHTANRTTGLPYRKVSIFY